MKLTANTLLGKIVRLPLKLIPKNLIVPLWFGKFKGIRWIVGAGPHGYWLGIAEREKRQLVESIVPTGSTVFDLGANVGYYSLLFARLVGNSGKVIAFEPSPRNLFFLHRHLEKNHIDNVQVFPYAVSNYMGTAMFDTSGDPVGYRLTENGNFSVKVVVLDDFYESAQLPRPDCIKIDVEGEELNVLKGAKQTISNCKPVLLIETHNCLVPGIHQECVNFLEQLGYRVNSFSETDGLAELYAVHSSY